MTETQIRTATKRLLRGGQDVHALSRFVSPTFGHLARAFSTGTMPHLHHQPSIRSSQAACDMVFECLKDEDSENVTISKLYSVIKKTGIQLNDPRLKETMKRIASFQYNNLRRDIPINTSQLDVQTLSESVHENIVMLHRIIQNDFVISNFEMFCNEIDAIYDLCNQNCEGEVASYIPQLARFDPKLWGVAVCTVDGQRHFIGDTAHPFCMQSTSKPINYALALTELGPDEVHSYVGFEPSGVSFNTITLNKKNKPHNPLINAGAIVVCSLIKNNESLADRFDYVMRQYRLLAGNEYLGFSNSTYLSERDTADRNFALGYHMKENRCFPEGTNLEETLNFYFQLCSLEVTCESASVMAATLANGGICPLTGERVFSPEAVRDTLSLMHSCGMYDYSGQFAFKCGLPAKSGVSGAILVVIPNVMGICLWSPALDRQGNSVRGLQFCSELVDRFNLHNYDSMPNRRSSSLPHSHSLISLRSRSQDRSVRLHGSQDSLASGSAQQNHTTVSLLFSAHSNDIAALRRAYMSGCDMESSDYDARTALHVAASDGHVEAVNFLLQVCEVNPNPKDRWGFLPLDEAERFNHHEVAKILRESGALKTD